MVEKDPTPARYSRRKKRATRRRLEAGISSHRGYRDDEIPTYRRCDCGRLVRADRADLIDEHLEICAANLTSNVALRW